MEMTMEKHFLWGNPFKKNTSTIEDEIEILSSVPIFDSLSRRQKIKLQSIMYVRNYAKGKVVFRQDDPGVGMYIVKEGEVEVFTENTENLTCYKISILNKGDFFGETSLLNESPRSATIIASQQSILLGLFKPELFSLIDSDPLLGYRLIYRLSQVVAERLRIANENLTRITNVS